jgi:hypothetical protein
LQVNNTSASFNTIKMKTYLLFALIFFCTDLFSQTNKTRIIDSSKKVFTVEASCGQCQFKMKGKGCTLAVRINGKAYFVEKAGIDEFGDAHSSEGFCNAIRNAKVQGEIIDNKFIASYFELIKSK